MARPNDRVHELWEMSRHEFDQWRRENDLPELLAFFKKALPHFEEWQSAHKIDDSVFLAPTQPSKFFRGDKPVFLVSMIGPDDFGVDRTTVSFHDRALDSHADREWQEKHFGTIRYRTNWELSFIPYFRWLRVAKGLRSFRIPGEGNAFTNDFEYRRTEAYNTIFSRAFLFHSHNVLKLGGVAIRAMCFDDRNLDFVDIDNLMVSGRGASRQTNIAYSSCRRLTLKNYDKPFVSFEKCPMEEPRFENCQLFGFKFIDSSMSRPVFRNARLSRFVLRRSMMSQANFDKCDLIDLTVSVPKRASAEGLANFYKRLRVAFQSQGERGEASRFYYEERFQQLRGHAFPLIPRNAGLPGLAYSGSLVSLYEHWERKQMDVKQISALLGRNVLRVLTIAIYPKFLLRFLREKFKVIPDTLDWLIWGFGERPSRVFYWMAFVIGSFAFRYYAGENEHLRGNVAESLSCSLYNFATIGCNHRGSFDSVEGILGAILLGTMVAGFSNRTRY